MIYHKGTQKINVYEANPSSHTQVFDKMTFQTKTRAPMTMDLENIMVHDYKVSLVLYQYTKYP